MRTRALKPGTIKLEVLYSMNENGRDGIMQGLANSRARNRLAETLGAEPIDNRVLVVYGEESAEVWFREAAVLPPTV